MLDLNDDQLLFGSHTPEAKGASIRGTVLERNDRGDSTKDLLQRYNISNDDDYMRLKMVRHEHIRRALQNLAVEHSMPAVRLQYPYVGVTWLFFDTGLLTLRSTSQRSRKEKQDRYKDHA